jgi:hypothetical protein
MAKKDMRRRRCRSSADDGGKKTGVLKSEAQFQM